MKRWKQWLPATLVFLLGLGMFLYGCRNGEQELILAKAIRICLECVGIG